VKISHCLGFAVLTALCACESGQRSTITLVDGDRARLVTTVVTTTAANVLAEAGIVLSPADAVLVQGYPVAVDAALPVGGKITLQIRRAATLTVDGRGIHTTASSVGEALAENGYSLYASDKLDPPAETSVHDNMLVKYVPARTFDAYVDGTHVEIRSAASSVGAVLAGAGLALTSLDRSQPAEAAAPPEDANIRVVRLAEALVLAQRALPFQNTVQDSETLALGQQQVLQAGENGLAVNRSRVRYEDGVQVSRQSEAEVMVRPPQNRLVAQGTKIELSTVNLGGSTIQYWRVLQMYATVYSPCNSGVKGQCISGTSSGLPAGKGVVAVDPSLFPYLNGQRLFIPGYGFAVVGDIGAGYQVEQAIGVSRYRWIDLGFDDNNIVDLTGWVTVYFLAPVPANIPDALK
jgi:uncharacterized protein YabE (DUF348 family)